MDGMDGIGSATRDGITFQSNTQTDEQLRERLDAPTEPVAELPAAESEVSAAEPVAAAPKKLDPTKDPATRIARATFEREQAKREAAHDRAEAARERGERERIQREYEDFKSKQTSAAPAQAAPTGEPTFEQLLEKHKDASDPYAAALREQARNDLRADLAAEKQRELEARGKYQQEQTARQRDEAEQSRLAGFGQKLQQALAADPNLEAAMASSELGITRPMADAIIESDAPEKLITHLLANPEEVDRIAALDSPLKQFRALARLDAQLESPAAPGHSGAPARSKSAASPPISPVGGGHAAPSTGEPDPRTCTQEEFEAYWNGKERAARMAGAR